MIIARKSILKTNLFKLVVACLVLAFAIFMIIAPQLKAQATANANNFQAGKIIDDSVFTNYNSMSVAQIQTFLTSKVSSCDTNGTQPATDFGRPDLTHAQYAALVGWSAPPYTCLKDYSENNLSAAQIIYNTAQQYRINPQVLIVLLQKEQALVTDTWPLPGQYKTATGYGCPDTSACDTQYYGLTNQLTWSGTMFRAIMDGNPNWYTPYGLGNYYIKWHPDSWNSSTNSWQNICGGTTVNIQNRATQALYNYTPYQPNAASLAAGYGTGDSCSSYGNRNFYLYFNDWFGSSSYSPPTCDSKLSSVSCVWELYSPNVDSNFLTTSSTERDSAIANNNYVYSSNPFYAFTSQQAGTVPIYDVLLPSEHFYTASAAERDSLLQNSQNIDKGIAFYAYPSSTATNASYPVYRLYNTQGHVFTASQSEKDSLIANGYTYEGVAFNAPSPLVISPDPQQNYMNIYRLSYGSQHLYTQDLSERDRLLRNSWTYEGIIFNAPAQATSTPIFRLVNTLGDHLFTASNAEKTQLVSIGWSYEGVAWYTDSTTPQTYRFYINGFHFFTANLNEALGLVNTRGVQYEGIAFGASQTSSTTPVYRLHNSAMHFYTNNTGEALSINNNGWSYEGVAWYASSSSTNTPIYRLYDGHEHFFTASTSEKDFLTSNGWSYEGVAWYGM